jgi:ferrochelatase
MDYCAQWYDHPMFVETWAGSIEKELAKSAAGDRRSTPVLFTAHSLPATMAARSPYAEQLQMSARLIAQKLGCPDWSIAYQSRSGKPSERWLVPDISEAIRAQAARGIGQMIVAPVGFVCDHVEVLYDLDIEARKIAGENGVRLLRASCPNDHPTFIQMMAEVIENSMKLSAGRG